MIYMTPDTWHLTPVLPGICMIIITRHLVILYSCTPVFLYSCTPVFMYSCISCTHALVNSTVRPASGRTCLVSG